MSWSTMSRPTEDEPAPVPVGPGGPSYLPCLPICQSIDRATFFPRNATSGQHGTGCCKTPLAFRHKPQPAKARSEEMGSPSVEASGRGGGWTGSKPHIRTNPDEGFPRAHQTPFGPGTTLLLHLAFSHTLTHSLYSNSNVRRTHKT